MTTKHTPTLSMDKAAKILNTKINKGVLLINGNQDWNEATKTAIRACNSHEILLKSLENLASIICTYQEHYLSRDVWDEIDRANETLGKTKGAP